MTLPLENLTWAADDVDPSNMPTRVVPPQELQKTGLLKGQPMGRQWFNYLLWYVCQVTNFSNRVGSVLTFSHTQADLDADTVHWKKTQVGNLFQYERIA